MSETPTFNLAAVLPQLLPRTIAWAQAESDEVCRSGVALTTAQCDLARAVGVAHPEMIRLGLVNRLPVPEDPDLREAANHTGLLGPTMTGLTLGYAVFICTGHATNQLFSHEFRHVHQFEAAGSLAAFITEYLQQIAKFGYHDAPLERDARGHERHS